jgi:hypothetical protein
MNRGFHLLDGGLQTLHRLLQCPYPRLKGPDVGLSLRWDVHPHLLRSGGLAVRKPGL